MDKVKLPKEIDKAINTCRMADISDYGIIVLTFSTAGMHMTPSTAKAVDILRKYTFSDMQDEDAEWKVSAHDGPARADKLLQALVNGYEVEQTPEDKVRDQYAQPHHFLNKDEDTEADIYRKGIKFALDTLNIKIEGINT